MKHTQLRILFFTFIALFSLRCSTPSYDQNHEGVIIRVNGSDNTGPHAIRIQVIEDDIIHVSAAQEKHFSIEESLITIPNLTLSQNYEVREDDNNVIVATQTLLVRVNKQHGETHFYDHDGNLLLQEKVGGGKMFAPINVEGTPGYSLQQVFESPNDEAFYGLGQHQSDEFNYKGKNETLFQYNTKVSVPFLISNKNYGILWDNYSLSRFGDPRDYMQLSHLVLYDKEGVEGAISATYQSDQKSVERREKDLNYEDLVLINNFPEGFNLQGAKVAWEGEIEAKKSGTHRFLLRYAGYVTVYLNDQEVVKERWRTAWNPNDFKFTQELHAGERVPFRVEWEPDGGESFISLKVLDPVPVEDQNRLSLWSEMGNQIDYYFIHGGNLDDVISGYRKVTGKSQIMPKWAMGFWQSRERYRTQEELVGTLAEFRERGIPIDNIVQDWSYWPVDAWGDHEFDPERFPDPKGMVDSVHRMNGRVMISVWPKFYITTRNYKAFDERGWMYQQAVKDSIRDWIHPGYIGSFYDAYAPGARELFWEQLEEKLYPLGFDAWWMDASEPNVRDNTSIEYRKLLQGPTALGPSTKYFNAYSLVNAESIYKGQRGVDPDRRVFLLTRSGFAGIQRYSTAVWSGDIGTRWEDMKAQISAGLNFALSGIPYWTMDIGGFCVEKRYEDAQRIYQATGMENDDLKEWRELNTRWHQFGAFVPLFRSHGQFPYREMFHIAPDHHPAYQSMLYYNQLRYRLMPYIYSLAGMTWFKDYTLMRALVMDFPNDPTVHNIGDQYLFGPSFMVCPVYEYQARNRNVYFPGSEGWYDFYRGRFIKGRQTSPVEAPYERMPLFVRAGSIIPWGPQITYSSEKQPDTITLLIYGGRDGHFTLYEDDGESYDYEKGEYATITFTYNEENKTLTIGDREGDYKGMIEERIFQVVHINQENPVAIDEMGTQEKTHIAYKGQELVIPL